MFLDAACSFQKLLFTLCAARAGYQNGLLRERNPFGHGCQIKIKFFCAHGFEVTNFPLRYSPSMERLNVFFITLVIAFSYFSYFSHSRSMRKVYSVGRPIIGTD